MAGPSFSSALDDENLNHFVTPRSNTPSSSKLSPLPPERIQYSHGTTVEISLDCSEDLKMELQAKEDELNKWEQELKMREDAVRRSELERSNWPPCFPLIHHDIANDIPAHLQKTQYIAFVTFLGLIICLVWNFIAITITWSRGADPTIWFLAVIYLLTGIPLAYISWYRTLYRAMRTESVLNFGWFFFSYMVHIGFCAYATVAPPWIIRGDSLTGILSAMGYFKGTPSLGMLYLGGAVLFCIEATFSVWVVQEVYMYFVGCGKRAKKLKKKAAESTMMPL